ncbi:adenylate kinase [Nitrososphaera viennensis]|uniref:Adenylate kinase n=2 Tax=Nitrososphaera viennensis TaxID=1034015 RepID=A0A060HR20_9ARCH|nr:adenylate kinase [Nitrososphaera viennensis]AIC15627.1 adenylate kinase [Nitrososphaera viennensis EN76]UVS70502.1 adenylate kinase [Nitrososphaera viennensis]
MAGNNKRAIIVGIPGVGKTTVITRAAELLSQSPQKRKATVVTYGTLMFEEAQKIGVKNRDEMRRLPVEQQKKLQETAARRIAEMQDDVVIVDTHLFISTREGYYPGLPMRLITIMNPTNLIMVAADPHEIAERRKNDPTRQRDEASPEAIKNDLDFSKMMLASCSILTGAPFAIVINGDGEVDDAAAGVADILAGGGEPLK